MSGANIELSVGAEETRGTPVVVEVVDEAFELVKTLTVEAGDSGYVELPDGRYGVRAQLPSGRTMTRSLIVTQDGSGRVELDLGRVSPSETREWAYLTKAVGAAPGRLDADEYRATWARLWRRDNDRWSVVEFGSPWSLHDADAAVYQIKTERKQHCLQLGGPSVPWKLVALPPGTELRVMVRPQPGPRPHVHPLEVTVASEDVRSETMLGYLSSGALAHAQTVNTHLAELMLYTKVANPSSAAVGGYVLLRAREYSRLHSWASNLADWMSWMADGPIIHAWQLIAQAHDAPSGAQQMSTQARERLLEAVRRGLPVYAEGLRLLHRGLRLFASRDRSDTDVADALERVSSYVEAQDASAPTTTFTGSSPEEPKDDACTGIPEQRSGLAFVFDVPFSEIVRAGWLPAGTKLTTTVREETSDSGGGMAFVTPGPGGDAEGGDAEGGDAGLEDAGLEDAGLDDAEGGGAGSTSRRVEYSAEVTASGGLRLEDGTALPDPDSAYQRVAKTRSVDAWSKWQVEEGVTLGDVREAVRRGIRRV